jgi:hypothetical protein
MIKQILKKWILQWLIFSMTVLIFGVWYAAITNVWTSPSTLEVNTNSVLTADSWNKLLWNFETLNDAINETPIIWSWTQTSERAGVWNFIWDVQNLNTTPGTFWWSAWQNYITINQAGYYDVYWDVLWGWLIDNQRQDARLIINRGGTLIYLWYSLWMGWVWQTYYKHHLREIWYFQAWDMVYIDINPAWSRYWHSTWRWSRLTIRKL